MNKLFLIILPLLFIKDKSVSLFKPLVKNVNDTSMTITVFGDKSYQLSLRIFDDNFDYLTNNSTLTLVKVENGKSKIIFTDSLMCMGTKFEMRDFNNDDVKDVLVYSLEDVRSNESYYLYLVDKKNKKLTRVKGFEEIKNPEFDSKNNVITSFAVSGTDYYSFYRINSKNKLINFNKGFDSQHDERDSIRYEKVMRQIKAIKN